MIFLQCECDFDGGFKSHIFGFFLLLFLNLVLGGCMDDRFDLCDIL